MDEYINSFIDETREMLLALEEDLLNLEKGGDEDEIIQNVFRTMHTLKGAARMYGFENMESLTHEFETLYDQIRNRQIALSDEIIDTTLRGKDVLAGMLENKESGKQEKEIIESVERYLTQGQEKPVKAPVNKDSESSSFLILLSPDKSVFERGLDPNKILDELKEMGRHKIIIHEPEQSWDAQKANKICETSWEIYLQGKHKLEEVKDVFLFYDEEEYTVLDADVPSSFSEAFIRSFFQKNYREAVDIERHTLENFRELADLRTDDGQMQRSTEVLVKEENTGSENQAAVRSKNSSNSTINVASKKIDDLMNLVSSLVSSTAELKVLAEVHKDYKLNNAIENIDKITKQFRNNALDLRLVPIGTLLNKFNRHVRDLSVELNKSVSVIIEGQETEIDKTILSAIEKPLLHIIRNSIDHGIESGEERIGKGKSEQGVLKITAFYTGANVVIQVQDDGRGFDLGKIKKTAIEKGYLEHDQQVSEKELLSFVMEPGFTTSDAISKVSGRGFGMDIVKKELNAVSGSIEIETEKDLGTFITLKLPATLSIIDTLMIGVGKSTLLLPLPEIEYCYQETWENIYSGENDYLKYHDMMLPFISLSSKFNSESDREKDEMVVVINKYDKKYGIIADRVIGEHQAVIKPLGELFINQPYFSGGSVMVDGELALMLDTNYLFSQLAMN